MHAPEFYADFEYRFGSVRFGSVRFGRNAERAVPILYSESPENFGPVRPNLRQDRSRVPSYGSLSNQVAEWTSFFYRRCRNS